MKRLTFVVLLLAVALAIPASATKQKSAKGVELLFQLEAAFAQDVAQHGHDAFFTHFADDGVELDHGGGIATKEEMHKQPAWPEGSSLAWTPVHGDMAKSGDLGYTYGTDVFKFKDQAGTVITNYGKYTSIWKKQKDGSWKVVVDMGNSSPPPKGQE